MYIPSWAILVIILLGGLTAGSWVGKSKGDYNFISPILGGAIYVITIVGIIAFLLGKYVF
jgi:hypothetical protein